MTDFREQIRSLLDKKKISIAKAAKLVDMNPQTLYNFMQERSEMTAANLAKLIDALTALH